ncbi:MAG: DUF167 domain-containing protein [Dehalococcoidia bacterium]
MSPEPVKLKVQVQPNSRCNEILGFKDGILKVKISSPPVEGKANRALVDFLSKSLGIRKSDISIEKGETGRRKTLLLERITHSQIEERLKLQS